MMSCFTDGKPRIATAEDLAIRWCGYNDGRKFRCHLCGEFILVGEEWRFVYANSTPGLCVGNFLAHPACCGDDPLARMQALQEEGLKRFWFLQPGDRSPSHPQTAVKRDRPRNDE